MHIKIETKGRGSKWITYRALKALRKWEKTMLSKLYLTPGKIISD